jgi:hypothetical protein
MPVEKLSESYIDRIYAGVVDDMRRVSNAGDMQYL